MAARWAHNPKVASSSLAPATNYSKSFKICLFFCFMKKATKKLRKYFSDYYKKKNEAEKPLLKIFYQLLTDKILFIALATSLNSLSKKCEYIECVVDTLECPALLLIICACIPLEICKEILVCLNP